MSTATEAAMSIYLGNRKLLQIKSNIEQYVLRPMIKQNFQIIVHSIIWGAIYRAWTEKDS